MLVSDLVPPHHPLKHAALYTVTIVLTLGVILGSYWYGFCQGHQFGYDSGRADGMNTASPQTPPEYVP